MSSHWIETRSQPPLGSVIPLVILERTVRFWWLVVVLMCLGGLAGWAYQRAAPPIYEARVAFTVSYDLTNMGAMTQFEQDHISGAVGDLLYSTSVMQDVVEDATRQGVAIDLAALKRIAFHERQAQIWYVRVRHADPQTAKLLADLWGERANAALTDAYGHGVEAQLLQHQLDSLTACLERSALVEPVSAQCSQLNLPDVQREMKTLSSSLTEAKLASRGILPSVLISYTEQAQTPTEPVLLHQGSFVLAGAVLGLLISIWVIELGLPEKFTRRAGRA